MIEAIKIAARDYIVSTNPVEFLFGNVISINPLKVNIDQRFDLTSEFLVLTERVKEKFVNVPTIGQIKINDGLLVGDKLLLSRMQGGQKYIVLDRVW